jgi:hypothetical protein
VTWRCKAAVALVAGPLVVGGCGSEPPEGPLAEGSDPTSTASPSSAADLSTFEMPGRGDPMRPSQPPTMSQTRQGAIEFATYRESIPADGFAPPVEDQLRESSSSSCSGCAQQLRFITDFNDKGLTLERQGPTRFHGVVDAFRDRGSWQVVLEYSLLAARGVDSSGKRVQTFKPGKFVQAVDTLRWEGDRWVTTQTKSNFLGATQIGER